MQKAGVRTALLVAGGVGVGGPGSAVAAPVFPIQPVAIVGDHAPGTPGNVFYGRVDRPAISPSGEVFFGGLLAGGADPATDSALWAGRPADIRLVAREGDVAPGSGGRVYDDLYNYALFSTQFADPGRLAFTSNLRPHPTDQSLTGVFVGGRDSVTMGAGPGTLTPDGPFTSASLTAASGDRVLVQGGAGGTSGYYLVSPTGISPVVRFTDPVPGVPGAQFSAFGGESEPRLNRTGHVAFRASYRNPGPPPNPFDPPVELPSGLWAGPADAIRLVARTGDPVPGAAAGTQFTRIHGATLNGSGAVAFVADTNDPTMSSGIWAGNPDDPRLVVGTGQPAPGAGGARFGGTPLLYQYNDAGDVAFFGTVQGGPSLRGGVWAGHAGDLHLVAMDGQQAPGTEAGNLFKVVNSIVMNNRGAVVVTATLTEPGESFGNADGIWAAEPGAPLQLVARVGDEIEVAPGDVRRIAAMDYLFGGGVDDGSRRVLNDDGQFVFEAYVADGTRGVFLSTVPEPAAISAALMSACFVLLRRRRGQRRMPL